MKTNYRGYEIDVRREKCLAGYMLMYVSILRIDDGYIAEYYPYDGGETVREMIALMKERIDNELNTDDPWLEKENGEGW